MFDAGQAKVTITADDQASKVIDKVQDKLKGTQSFTDKYSASISKIGKIADRSAKVAAGALVYMTKKAIDSYGSYEQLSGGVQKLFKTSADTVMKNADKAYKTAGISANKYMEQATSFSASLIQGLNGDTAKAAKIADVAIKDMSDNVNTFGSTQQSVQDAYKGFAKQNFTMLDNLKLGYGGTKTEMERLLADAEKLTGKKYDISNFADIVEAIHAVQKEYDITGTTAKEAAHTIEGSVNTMKSAWDNWLTAIGSGDSDKITQTTDNLVASIKTVGKNVIPVIGNVMKSLKPLVGFMGGAMLVKFASKVMLATNALTKFQAANAGVSVVSGVLQGKLTASEGILGSFGTKVSSLATGLNPMTTGIIAAAGAATLIGGSIYYAYQQTHKYRNEVEDLTQANRESVDAINANYDAAEFYLGKVDALMEKDHRTAEEKRLLAAYCDAINDALGENVISYDAEKDALNENTAAVRDNIAAKKEAALAEAYSDNYAKSLQKQVELERQLTEAKEEQATAQAQFDKESQNGFVSPQTSQRLEAAKNKVKDLSGAYKKAGDDAKYWGDKMDETLKTSEKTGDKKIKVEADTTDAEKKIDNVNKKPMKKKESKVSANAKAAYKEFKKVEAKKIKKKTAKVGGDNKDAIKKVDAVNKKKVSKKKTTITATDKASPLIDRVNRKGINNKHFSITASISGLAKKVLHLRKGARDIPYDGYEAVLHKGERVLTAPEVNHYDAIMKSLGKKAMENRNIQQENVTRTNQTVYNIGDVSLEVSKLEDVATLEDIVKVFRKAKAFV